MYPSSIVIPPRTVIHSAYPSILQCILLFQPGHYILRNTHRRESTLTHQRPIIEQMALFDLSQGNWLGKPSYILYIHNPAFRIIWIRTWLRDNSCQTHNRSLTLAMVDQQFVISMHDSNSKECRGTAYTIPNRRPITF